MRENNKPITIGVAGGSGAGKTTVSQMILERLGANNIAYIPHDSYYKDLSELPREQRKQINFDHPDSLDTELFIKQIEDLQRYEEIKMPVYDFSTHSRLDEVIVIKPHNVILVEGILIFSERRLRELMDIRIFVETDDDVRLIRRLQRDTRDRGRSVESVLHQWMETVRPMHQQFVEPSRRHAHVIIPEGGYNQVALDMVIAHLQAQTADI